MATITLGGAHFDVNPLPYKTLRKIIPLLSGLAVLLGDKNHTVDENDMEVLAQIICAGTGKTAAELDEIPAAFDELMEAYKVIAEVSGLAKKSDGNEGKPA